MTQPFVSYAQNFEDVILWRALKDIDRGFYVDVGAYLPAEHSVTAAFYERGWRGINIEPHPKYLAELMAARPRDINLGVAIGDSSGELEMSFIDDTGLSTLDPREARQREIEGRSVGHGRVQVETLSAVWSKHVPGGQPVHFMKVDVEGYEYRVICGNDWGRNRPWIVLVEATSPTTTQPSFEDWDPLLIGNAYSFVYFDGLNRFYIANEHSDLAQAFGTPPNVFDDFVQVPEKQAEIVATFARRAASAEERADAASFALRDVQSSRSWRLTRPLRIAADWVRRIRGRDSRSRE